MPIMASEPTEQDWRAALSAMLDGEEPPLPVPGIAAHLTSCPDCSAWLDRATTVNRSRRTLPVLDPELGGRLVTSFAVHLCACRTGGECLCGDCQCGPDCTCRVA